MDGTAVAKVAKVANEAMMNEVLNANMAVSVGCWFVGWLVVVVVGVQVVSRLLTIDQKMLKSLRLGWAGLGWVGWFFLVIGLGWI